jgi:molybdopterin-guanine dinucleotide biosynthesis protein A
MKAVSAFVLAGGKSTRMGAEKAFLELRGRSLLAKAIQTACSVAADVSIVGDRGRFSAFGKVIEDTYSDRGPLGGIHAALTASGAELNLMIGVDLPFLEARFLKHLVLAAEGSHALVTVPRVAGFYEPLCAVYRKEFGALADEALAANHNKVDALFSGIPLRIVDDEELAQNGFPPAMFRNVNTIEDWRLVQEEFARREHVS